MEARIENGVENLYRNIHAHTLTHSHSRQYRQWMEIITVPERPLFILHCYFHSVEFLSHFTVRQHTSHIVKAPFLLCDAKPIQS